MAYKTVIGRENVDSEIKGLYTETTHVIKEKHTRFNVKELPVGTRVTLVHCGELVTGEVVFINPDRVIILIESMSATVEINVHSAFCAELEMIK